MKSVAAYILLTLGGNATPSAEDIEKVVTAAGGEHDADATAALLKDLEGKTIADVIAAGQARLATVPTGGGGGGGGAGGDAAAEEEKEEEKEEEEKEEEAAVGNLFGGDGDDDDGGW